MKEVLLTSEPTVKGLTAISDNVESKYLLPAIREAQEVYLREILGDALLAELKHKVETNFAGSFSPSFNASFQTIRQPYKELVDKCQYYLAYKAVELLIPKVAYKIANMGVVKTSDENIQPATYNEIVAQRDFYTGQADYNCLTLQNYILQNKASYPELTENQANSIHSHLRSAASCGIWLGGPRGK